VTSPEDIEQDMAEILSLPVLQPVGVERLLWEAAARFRFSGWILGSASNVTEDASDL
jgi:hypothetical protein